MPKVGATGEMGNKDQEQEVSGTGEKENKGEGPKSQTRRKRWQTRWKWSGRRVTWDEGAKRSTSAQFVSTRLH